MKHIFKILPIVLIIVSCSSTTNIDEVTSKETVESSVSKKASYDTLSLSDVKEIMRLAIDLPLLEKHYHVDVSPRRKPLKIKEFGLINARNFQGMKKFGEQILVLNEAQIKELEVKDYLSVADWTPVNGKMRLQLSYSVEGVMVNYMFEKKDEKWVITDSLLMEI